MLYANVRILNLPYSADKSYEYQIPLQLEEKVKPGSIVLVPFGGANKVQTALVQSISNKNMFKKNIKPVLSAPGKYMFVKKELLELCLFMSEKLLCSVGEAAKCVLPAGLGVQKTSFYSLNEEKTGNLPEEIRNSAASDIIKHLSNCKSASETELAGLFGYAASNCMKKLVSLGICSSFEDYTCKVSEKKEKYVEINEDAHILEAINTGKIKLTPKQSDMYELLSEEDTALTVSELLDMAGVSSPAVLRELAKKGAVRVYDVGNDRQSEVVVGFNDGIYSDFELEDEQITAYEKLYELYKSDSPKAALLHGVTGSGKTNVILKLIDRVLEDGKTVIVLVPEIALTSQTVGRFAARYKKDGIALIHSGLSAGERIDAWRKINDGEAKIVIGTRSAAFAPVENLGLIVMDEEHEGSFKSDKSPKYHARDIARFRCAYNNALLVMASATPSIESYYRAKSGRYELVELNKRYGGAELPEVEFYDMKNEPYFVMPEDRFEPAGIISGNTAEELTGDFIPDETSDNQSENPEKSALPLVVGKKLESELTECLERREQSIVFINRRGYRAFALCRSCGYVFTCPNCSVSMTYHKGKKEKNGRMVCHYCGYYEEIPRICPECGKKRVSFVGSGTQLLEESLKKTFVDANIIRMDADTTKGKASHQKILNEFRCGNADILVGTQMVAKGHDFPRVSLVGVALADTSLFVNDFRANEKTFSLITQVLGRAGRSKSKGKAVIQTYVPDNDVLNLAAKQDYKTFYEKEIAFRKANVFPPFCDIVTVGFSAMVENDLVNAVKLFAKGLDETAKNEYSDVKFILYGPFKNEIYRMAGKYRMRFIIKCRNTSRTREMLSKLMKKYTAAFKNVNVSVDINPTNL